MYFAIMHMDNNCDNDNNRLGCDSSPEGTGRESRGNVFFNITAVVYYIVYTSILFQIFSDACGAVDYKDLYVIR